MFLTFCGVIFSLIGEYKSKEIYVEGEAAWMYFFLFFSTTFCASILTNSIYYLSITRREGLRLS